LHRLDRHELTRGLRVHAIQEHRVPRHERMTVKALERRQEPQLRRDAHLYLPAGTVRELRELGRLERTHRSHDERLVIVRQRRHLQRDRKLARQERTRRRARRHHLLARRWLTTLTRRAIRDQLVLGQRRQLQERRVQLATIDHLASERLFDLTYGDRVIAYEKRG